MRLAGKRAIVTGGAGGLGRSIVEAFVAEGARVLIADLEPAEGEVAAIHLDVTSAGDWAAAVGRMLAMWGGVDILINNAGVASGLVQIGDRTPDEWDRMMQVNAKGCFLGTQAVLPAFCAQGGAPSSTSRLSQGWASRRSWIPPMRAARQHWRC